MATPNFVATRDSPSELGLSARCSEKSSQMEIAEELEYITAEDRSSMDVLVEEEARLLSGLLNSYKATQN